MILANGALLPDSDLPKVLSGLEAEINHTRSASPLEAEAVVDACATLLDRLDQGDLDHLLSRFATPQLLDTLGRYRHTLQPESLRYKLAVELDGLWTGERPRPFGRSVVLPLGTRLHIAAGNMEGLPAFSALEGLLTGNVNLLKLPSGDTGLSLALLKLLTDTQPDLAPYLYVFSIPSADRTSLEVLASLADGIVTWGGDEAVRAARSMAPAGCKLIEWSHRLSFAYVSGRPPEEEWYALARHILSTGGLLCSSCQVIYLDTDSLDDGRAFCHSFLPILERAAAACHPTPGQAAQATLHGYEHFLEQMVRNTGAQVFPGRGCSVTLCPDQELELSPLHGNILVKRLPRSQLFSVLRRQKGRLQTAGLLCPPEEREELTALLVRAGLTRITAAGTMSAPFPGAGHDGEHPLRRYVRIVDIE